ncbi:MAG: hypothetical protein QOG49_1505 [Frankiaceae bacterium]|nr:hypothetical protein [Frankiaceae bacterium]
MSRGRFGARRLVLLVLTPILAFYLFIPLRIAWSLARDGRAVSIAIAVALVALVGVSLWLVVAELRFGRQVETLSRAYDAAPAAAADTRAPLPLTPSGRPDRDAADEAFDEARARVEQQPGDWRAWYELGLAYADARDSARGRSAMRRAISLRTGER